MLDTPMNQLIILAGGMGTRLRARLGDLPKPMIPIAGKPLLELQIELAKSHGFNDILIFACYRADLIEQHFGDGNRWGLRVRTIVEREPLGTAGAVLAGFDLLADNFVVMYGDTMVNVDLQRICQAHLRHQADATLLLHPNDHPLDSDLVEANTEGWVTAFHNRPHPHGPLVPKSRQRRTLRRSQSRAPALDRLAKTTGFRQGPVSRHA